jgi:hypothetical protein
MVISFQRGLVVIGLRRPAGDMSAGSQPQPRRCAQLGW